MSARPLSAPARGRPPGPSPRRKRRIVRNLVLYLAGVMALSLLGSLLVARGAEAGALLFLVGPLLMTVLLRSLAGDGWKGAGLRLGRASWYAFALLLFPIAFGAIVAIGAATGAIVLTGTFGAFLAAVALEVAPRMLFAGFEEVGWRGYLEPQLAELGVPDLERHVAVGLIWAVWHVPYVLAFAGYSELAAPVFAPLFLAGVMAMAVVYGQLRQLSGSVWPVVVAHGVGNALAFPLLFGGFALFHRPALLATRPESLAFIAIWSALGWLMIRHGRRDPAAP